MVQKIFRMVSRFTGVDGAEINTIYYAVEQDSFNYYKEALADYPEVSHSEILGVYTSDGLYNQVLAAGRILGVESFPEGDLSEAFSSKNGTKILNMKDPFWYKEYVQETIPVNPQPTHKESVMSTARAKAQPSAVASAASQVASAAPKTATGSAEESAPSKTVPLSRVMEAAASAAKAASEQVNSAVPTANEVAAVAMSELAQAVQSIGNTAEDPHQSPQPVAAQQSTQAKEDIMADKKQDDVKTVDAKKPEDGIMTKTKSALTGPTAKTVGLVLLAAAAGAAGGYGAVEMQRRRQMAAKGRMA